MTEELFFIYLLFILLVVDAMHELKDTCSGRNADESRLTDLASSCRPAKKAYKGVVELDSLQRERRNGQESSCSL